MSNNANEIVELDVTNDDMNEMLESETVAPVAEQAPVAQDTPAEDVAPVAPVKKKKRVMCRLWAIILALAPVALLCLMPTLVLVKQASAYGVETEKTMLDAFLALINEFLGKDGLGKFYASVANAPASLEGFEMFSLPLLAGSGLFGKVYSLGLYAMALGVILNVCFMFVAIFSGKKAPKMVRAISFMNLFVFGTYLLGVLAIAKFYLLEIELTAMPVLILGGIVALSLLVYLVTALKKVKKVRAANFFLLLLSAVWVGCFAYAYLFVNAKTGENVRGAISILSEMGGKSLIPSLTQKVFFQYLVWGVCVLSILNLFISAIRLSTKKGFLFDVLRHVLHLIVAGLCVYVAFTTDIIKELGFMDLKIFVIVAAVVAFLQIIIASSTRARLKKGAKAKKEKAKKAEKEVKPAKEKAVKEEKKAKNSKQPVVAPVESKEEVSSEVEAVRYDYAAELVETPAQTEESPVVEEEEEVVEETIEEESAPESEPAPSTETPTPVLSTPYGYDFYNSQAFDPFIATLNDEERKQFTDIFILKNQGETKNLPDYVVGGDNSAFFKKIFIYLGQYREKIPSTLLAKMYNFSSKK